MPKQTVDCAKMTLDSEQGKPVKQIAQELNTYPNKVIYWRKRYVEKGLEGLNDNPRSGRPAIYDDAFRYRVLKLLSHSSPKGLSAWDGPELAKMLNVKADAVWKVLRKEGIHLQQQRSWCISTDKDFASKAADIVGLYLAPPMNAIVLCVDEKPSIQALERKTGFIKTDNGKVVRAYKSTYKRHGTLNLFAVLEVSTDRIKVKITEEKKRINSRQVMSEVEMGILFPQPILQFFLVVMILWNMICFSIRPIFRNLIVMVGRFTAFSLGSTHECFESHLVLSPALIPHHIHSH